MEEFPAFFFFFAKAEFKAGETKFLRAMSHQVSPHGRVTFTPLYHWWNRSKTLAMLFVLRAFIGNPKLQEITWQKRGSEREKLPEFIIVVTCFSESQPLR